MNLFLDNIIFSIQKAGGISVVWGELLKRILADPDILPAFIEEYNNGKQNIFREEISIPEDLIIEDRFLKLPVYIKRYFAPSAPKGKGIFHSSYYRTINNPQIVNVTTVHDFTYENYRKGIALNIHKWQKGSAIKNSSKIICVSESTKRDLFRFYPNLSEDKVKVIYNGVDRIYSNLELNDDSLIKEFFPFSRGSYALYVGERRSPHKNFGMVVDSCSFAKVPLVMVGGGKLSAKEESLLTEKLGKSKYKHINGVDNKHLNVVYNHALCLLYPSLYEGFGIPILEAQRAGCPVISTNLSSIPEVAGSRAILLNVINKFNLADSLLQLKNSPSQREELRSRGFRNSKLFSWDKCYEQTKQVYKELYDKFLTN